MERDPLLPHSYDEDEKSGAPWLLPYRCSKYFILATVAVATFTDTFFYAVIIPTLPFVLRDRCNIPEEDIQFWSSTLLAIFGASVVIGSPIGGYCADNMRSRKIPFYAGLVVLAASTILFGFTSNIWILMASRVCFGFSSAIVYTVGLALLIDSVDHDEVGEWLGTALAGATVGITVSPLLGGFVYAKTGLQGILAMMIAIVIIDVVMRFVMIERGEAARWLGPSVLPKKKSPNTEIAPAEDGTSSEEQTISKDQKKKTAPMLRLLQSPRVWADLYGVFMQFGILNAFDAVLPLFVKQSFLWTSTGAGLIFLNLAAPTLLSPFAGKLCTKYGTRHISVIGCITGCPALICLRFVTKNSPAHVALLCVLLVLVGLSLTLVMTPLAADLSLAVDLIEEQEPGAFGPRGAYGQVYALFNISMSSASVFGPVLAGSIRIRFGWAVMSLVLGLWCVSAAVPVSFLLTDGATTSSNTASSHDEDEHTQ